MEEALEVVEEAIAALGRGDPDSARAAMAEATGGGRDLRGLADAMALATAELEADGAISDGAWDTLADACPVELHPVIEMWRR